MTSRISRSLRQFRLYHRWLGIALALLLLLSAATGVLLAWKKNVDLLQPPTQKGVAAGLEEWMPLADLAGLARQAMRETLADGEAVEIDRLDVRPNKGIVKVLFKKGWWEVQVDGRSGEVLSVARRHSDWIEQVHDGSIVSDAFKLVSMNVLGAGILVLVASGFWLWYGPRLYRRLRRGR